MYYPCSENKGADQLRGYREADLRLCFRLCRLLVFPCGGSFVTASCIVIVNIVLKNLGFVNSFSLGLVRVIWDHGVLQMIWKRGANGPIGVRKDLKKAIP